MSEPAPGRQPSLRPTEPATLVVAGLAAAAAAWLLINNFYRDLPPMIWPPVIIIAGGALFEAAVAQDLFARIHQRGPLLRAARSRAGGGPEPVEPLTVARYAVLAKASSIGGAILAGLYAGFLPWLVVEAGRVTSAGADLPPTIGGLLAASALLAAGLLLERACRVPEPPEDRDRQETPEADS